MDILSGGSAIDVAVSRGGTLQVTSGGLVASVTVSDGGKLTISSGGSEVGVTVDSGGTEIVSGLVTALGTVTLDGFTSVAAHAVFEMLSGGTAVVTGSVTNGGTLFANGSGSLVEFASGAVVNGGLVESGDGLVAILGSSGENVNFLSTGSGGLAIADTSGHTSAFKGRVSGFGGTAHANKNQFIDLVSVTSAGLITSSYVSANAANTSGTLFVPSGSTVVAAIAMIGHYSAGNFVITAGGSGEVEITDPTVPNGGSVVPGPAAAFPQQGIDLPNIGFGARTTLAYAENAAGTGGTLTVSDGRHAASIVLLGNYMAGSFAVTADGHGGTLVTEGRPDQQPLLTHPQRG